MIKSGVFQVDMKFFFQKNKKCEIAKNKVAKITCTYFGDKSQKLAPAEKTSYTVYTCK